MSQHIVESMVACFEVLHHTVLNPLPAIVKALHVFLFVFEWVRQKSSDPEGKSRVSMLIIHASTFLSS